MNPNDSFSTTFGDGAALALVRSDRIISTNQSKAATVFASLGADGGIQLFWGLAADGSVVICDSSDIVKSSCGKSHAPFPTGCMFHSEGGLKSFEQPMNRMKAMPRVDSEGVMCGANFKVDKYSRINSMPRVGSETNWASWTTN